jgi:hypothetical protein
MSKVFSMNEDIWEENFSMMLDRLADRHGGDRRPLVGLKYFEGDKILVPTGELFCVDVIICAINEQVYEVMGEWGEDYPTLDEQERGELKDLIVGFLDKKDPHGFFHVKNVCKKEITEKDLESNALTECAK